MRIAIGIDTGGTCTDAVVFDYDAAEVLAKSKTLTTREDLSIGISKALDMLPQHYIKEAAIVSLSTTLATNACVENKGGRAKLVIFGLTDELMERLKVEENYGIKHGFVRCVDTKSSVDGQYIDEPNWDELFGDLDCWIKETDYMAAAELYGPSTGAPCEKRFKSELMGRYGLSCICANELTDRVDVIQRGATALLNARLLPVVQEFIDITVTDITKRGCKAPIMVVRSDGSLMSTDATAIKPVETILSGPAASILAGKAMSGSDDYMVIDMGGTTTDVSVVMNGKAKNVGQGIKIGGWRTSVDGVYVDTFALGGDSTIRMEKGELKILPRRCIPLCTASSRWPSVKPMLDNLIESGEHSKFPLYEFLCLVTEPKDTAKYNEYELKLIDLLKSGPCSLHEVRNRGIDLYGLNTERLEEEGVIIRCGLTPTDFMHIRGDYTEYDAAASEAAVQYLLSDMNNEDPEEDMLKLADRAYDLVERRMYTNLVRILLSLDYPKKLSDSIDKDLEFLIDQSWTNYKNGIRTLANPVFNTDMVLLGMGAPTHVFLNDVAKALGTECVLPDNAEIGNAIGAVMADLIVRENVEITQWETDGLFYMVHDEKGSTKHYKLADAEAHARKSAAEAAVKEARLRGAAGELTPVVTQKGNSHEKEAGTKLAYGGIVSAEVRFSFGKGR